MNIREIIAHTVTGKDGKTIDVGRILWVLSTLTFLGLGIFHVVQNKSFSPQDFGIGAGSILGGGGAALGFKKATEPD